MDPFVDDSVAMAKRLKALGKSVELNVLTGLPHGFLNLIQVRISVFLKLRNTKHIPFFVFGNQVSKDAQKGNRVCIAHLANLLGTTLDSKK